MTDSLLSRLTSLTGPDREIDAEIALATGYRWPEEPPRYTASIDAALTLLGDKYAIDGTMIWPGLPARITIVGVRFWDGKYWHEAKDGRWTAEGATIAIAIVIAIMKAKEPTP